MTALFRVIVQKLFDGEYWVNDYVLRAEDMDAAISGAGLIGTAEAAFLSSDATITSWRTSTLAPDDGLFYTSIEGFNGDHSPNGTPLALFDAVRVDFGTGSFGLPGRKFYRAVLATSDLTGYTGWSGPTYTLVSETIAALLGDLEANATPLVNPHDVAFTGYVVKTHYTNRQLRRGSKRRVTPII